MREVRSDHVTRVGENEKKTKETRIDRTENDMSRFQYVVDSHFTRSEVLRAFAVNILYSPLPRSPFTGNEVPERLAMKKAVSDFSCLQRREVD